MDKIRLVFWAIVLVVLLVIWIALPDYFFKVGLGYYKSGDYVNAYKNLFYSRLWNKSNSDYRYYYAQTLAKFKPTLKIQKEMYEFAESSKEDSARIFAEIQVNIWKNNIMQQYGSNYIEQAPVGKDIIRWNPKTFPLKVFVSSTIDKSYPEYYNTEVTRAFGQWAASSGFIAFDFIDNPNAADIVVNFQELPKDNCSENGCKYIIAHTVPTIKKNILKQMTITVYDRDANGSFFSDKELYNTVLHEIGHALGIMGHSYSTDDLMYMTNENSANPLFVRYRSDFQYISIKDVSTLRLLYNIVPTISNTPVSEFNTQNLIYPPIIFGNTKNLSKQKLKEAKNYIEQAPNIPNGYIDLAIAYDDLGQFEKALEAFQKAFNLAKTNSDKYIVLYNLAAMYLNNNNPETALSYAKQAQQINRSEEIAELIGNIEHAINTKTAPFWINKILK